MSKSLLKMNPEIKKQWLEALRSGGYRQGVGSLRYRKGGQDLFCCLGVLCDLHSKATGKEWTPQPGDIPMVYLGECEWLPAEVRDWADLEWTCPCVLVEGVEVVASALNDDEVPFTKIAAAIEASL